MTDAEYHAREIRHLETDMPRFGVPKEKYKDDLEYHKRELDRLRDAGVNNYRDLARQAGEEKEAD